MPLEQLLILLEKHPELKSPAEKNLRTARSDPPF